MKTLNISHNNFDSKFNKLLKQKGGRNIVRSNFDIENIKIVMVTNNTSDLRQRLISEEPSEIKYTTSRNRQIMIEDKIIENYPLQIRPEKVASVCLTDVFINSNNEFPPCI